MELNSELKFIDNDGSGITSLVKVCVPNYQIVLESQSMVKEFKPDLESEYNKMLNGLKEVYTIIENGDKSRLEVYYELPIEWLAEMEPSWMKAVDIIKELAEILVIKAIYPGKTGN